jgi:CheY-like chemotaxis protein
MKILIADDDPISRCILKMILEKAKWEVQEAADGKEAWEALQTDPKPDLCVFDISMPHFDGLTLLQKIRDTENLSPLKVILCTSFADRSKVESAAKLSVAAYIIKPYKAAAIVEKIESILSPPSNGNDSEAIESVCRRLQIDQATLGELVTTLKTQLADVIDLVEKEFPIREPEKLVLRVNVVKSAAANLGCSDLAKAAGILEQELRENRLDVFQSLEGLIKEKQKVDTLLGKLGSKQ